MLCAVQQIYIDETCDKSDSVSDFIVPGTFAILGGPLEMPWAYDRLFKYDVTDVFSRLHLRQDSEYHFVDHIVAVNGTELDSHLIRPPTVQFVPGVKSESLSNSYVLLSLQ